MGASALGAVGCEYFCCVKCVRKCSVEVTRLGWKQPIKKAQNLTRVGIRDLEFRDFEESEIPRNLKFVTVTVLCRGHMVPARKRRGGGERARDRAFKTRFHTPNHAHNAPKTLRSKFGEIENSRSENFGEFWNSRF